MRVEGLGDCGEFAAARGKRRVGERLRGFKGRELAQQHARAGFEPAHRFEIEAIDGRNAVEKLLAGGTGAFRTFVAE